MKKLLILTIVLALSASPTNAEWLPSRNTVAPPAGGPRMLDNHAKFFSIVGGTEDGQSLRGSEVAGATRRPVYNWNVGGDTIQGGIEGGIYSHFQSVANEIIIISTDFSVGIPLEYRTERSGYRVKLFHVSSHLGDEFQTLTGRNRISFSHESLRGLYFHNTFNNNGRVYVGGEYAINIIPEEGDWVGIAGYEITGRGYFSTGDIRVRERNNWDPSIMIQAGYSLKDGAMKAGLEFFDGPLATGQFFREERSYVGLLFTFEA